MKRTLSITLALLLCLPLAGCRSAEREAVESEILALREENMAKAEGLLAEEENAEAAGSNPLGGAEQREENNPAEPARGNDWDGILSSEYLVRGNQYWFESKAVKNGKTSVSVVTKANIMKKTDGRFSEIAHEVAEKEYPGLVLDDYYIDIMTANLVNEKIRSGYEVFLLPNLYGDILTDEAAQIQGGVGTAGSANIGDRYAMFEAIHGSAPRMVEAGLAGYANPSSILTALAMLLNHIGKSEEAKKLENALQICTETEKRLVVTGDTDGATCEAFTAYLMEKLGE